MNHQPSNFSWVSDSVAGFAFPYDDDEKNYLANVAKLSHVITMCHEKPDFSKYPSISHHHFPVDNFTAASLSTIKKAISVIQEAEAKNEKVGVHCQYGQGRAGTILACYLAYKYHLDGDSAIQKLRQSRPGSVDDQQEEVVKKYANSLKH